MAENRFSLWLALIADSYRGAASVASTQEEVAAARRSIERDLDERRAKYRSRAGRLWATQSIERRLGPLIGEVLAGSEDTVGHQFEAVDALKARLLLDQMADCEAYPSRATRQRLAELERDVLRFKASDPDHPLAELQLLSKLSVGLPWVESDRSDRLLGLEQRYSLDDAGFRSSAGRPRLEQIQAALAPGEGLLEYFIPTHPTHPARALFALGVTRDEVEVIPIPLTALPTSGMIGTIAFDGRQPLDVTPLSQVVFTMRQYILAGDDVRADVLLDHLWRLLILPILNTWHYPDECSRWIIVPHGPLHYVPFGALRAPGGGPRLIEEIALTICPSAAVWLALRQRRRPPARSFLGVADPLLRRTTLPPLTDALKELSSAMTSLKDYDHTPLPADLATEGRVRAEIPGKSIVHFAAHGEFPEMDPFDFHRILLAETADHDGRLDAEGLRSMDLSAARLVVLSICDGGLYRCGPGDEPLGLIPAILIAGAENVLATLWEIEDRAARRITSAFYRHLVKAGPAEALRRAARGAIKKPLRDWAGFVNTGTGRRFDDEPESV